MRQITIDKNNEQQQQYPSASSKIGINQYDPHRRQLGQLIGLSSKPLDIANGGKSNISFIYNKYHHYLYDFLLHLRNLVLTQTDIYMPLVRRSFNFSIWMFTHI